MAEPVSIAASVLTIGQFAAKSREYSKKIMNAPANWQRDCDELDNVGHVEIVLKDILDTSKTSKKSKESKDLLDLTIPIDGKPKSIVEYRQERLRIVREEAKVVLNAPNLAKAKKKGLLARLPKKIWRAVDSVQFFLKEDQIRELLQAVEHAKSSLQSALFYAQLQVANSDGSHKEIKTLLQGIREDMVKHSNALEVLHKSQQLDKTRTRPKKSGKQKKKSQAPPDTEPVAQAYETFPSGPAPSDSPRPQSLCSSTGGDSSLGCINEETAQAPIIDARCADTLGGSGDEAGSPAASINSSEIAVTTGREWVSTLDDENAAEDAVSHFNDPAEPDYLSDHTFILISDNDELWETDDELSEVEIEMKDRARVEIRSTVDPLCHSLCAEQITLEGTQLRLVLRERCTSDSTCDHVIIQGRERRPDDLQPRACCFNFSNQDGFDHFISSQTVAPDRGAVLQVNKRCQDTKNCEHTVIQGQSPLINNCAIPAIFRVFGNGSTPEPSEIESRSEYASEDSGSMTGSCSGGEDELPPERPQFPEAPDSDDDEDAFNLVASVMRGVVAELPESIGIEEIWRYIFLVDKYELEDKFLEQARQWVEPLRSQLPTVFDEETVAWLILFWKFDIKPEFKTISALIQRNADRRLDQVIPGLTLPNDLIDRIDQGRVTALTRIKDHMTSQLELSKAAYNAEVTRPARAGSDTRSGNKYILSSSLLFGYLTLEKERCLGSDTESDGHDFTGVSFSRACTYIRSMMHLDEWKIAAMVPLDRYPEVSPIAAGLALLIMAVGETRHASPSSVSLSSDYKKELIQLISELEKEDWGIDLE